MQRERPARKDLSTTKSLSRSSTNSICRLPRMRQTPISKAKIASAPKERCVACSSTGSIATWNGVGESPNRTSNNAGCLSVEYPSLDELAGDEEEWQAVHPALAELAVGERAAILRILLDWMRRNLAIKVDVLDEREQERLQSESNQRLTGEWALEDQRLTYATAVVPRGRATNDARDLQYLSARGAYGQYLRRPTVLGGAHHAVAR